MSSLYKFKYREIVCEIIEHLGYLEGRVYMQIPDRDFIAHHGINKRTSDYVAFFTNHLCDRRTRFRGGNEKGVDYVAYQLKLAIDHFIATKK